MRRRIFEIIEEAKPDDQISKVYDLIMMFVIISSMIPLALKTQTKITSIIDQVAVIVFIIDYVMRLLTADYKFPNFKSAAFFVYPFSPMAIIDLLAILPSVSAINSGLLPRASRIACPASRASAPASGSCMLFLASAD